MMTKQRKNSGFTLAEMLIVVAITIILMGVAFIAVQNHQRSMTRLEFDSIAKEIFVAAQNHLTAAQSQGYLQADEAKLGTEHTTEKPDVDEYIIYKDPNGFTETILDLLLPFGSLDETVRAGGSYVIRYQPSSGRVLEVFYSLQGKSSLLTISGKTLTSTEDDYDGKLKPCAGDDAQAKRGREKYSGGVIGWYGGEEGLERGEELKAPEIKVFNEETLRVEVTDNNAGTGSLKLIITGAVSGAQKAFDLRDNSDVRIEAGKVAGTVNVTLDDITQSGFHFAELSAENGKSFIPGENVIIEAVAFDNSKLTNIAYSGKKTTNSLFADLDKDAAGKHIASVANFRHLANLDAHISNLDNNDSQNKLTVASAIQTANLDWEQFRGKVDADIVPLAGDGPETECFLPVTPQTFDGTDYTAYSLNYDGHSHKIFNVKVDEYDGAAGLFGSLADESKVKDLELIDFSITSSSGSAGALVGTATGTTITNVLAYNDKTTGTSATVTASSGDAGGLIGSATNCEVTKCAAALVVSGSANAGGLIGSSTGGEVKASYSGGHTYSGAPTYSGSAPSPARTPNAVRYYDSENKPIYNVTGGTTAGGLIGNAGNTEISYSYSTCSAKAADNSGMAGGFVGTSSGTITNCYCTGLVSGTTEGAFAGSLSGTATECKYFEIINEIKKDDDGKEIEGYNYLKPVGNVTRESIEEESISAFDNTALTYDQFCIGGKDASPYDISLKNYYQNKYNLQTVEQLNEAAPQEEKVVFSANDFVKVHYGDWPAPEEFVFN